MHSFPYEIKSYEPSFLTKLLLMVFIFLTYCSFIFITHTAVHIVPMVIFLTLSGTLLGRILVKSNKDSYALTLRPDSVVYKQALRRPKVLPLNDIISVTHNVVVHKKKFDLRIEYYILETTTAKLKLNLSLLEDKDAKTLKNYIHKYITCFIKVELDILQ